MKEKDFRVPLAPMCNAVSHFRSVAGPALERRRHRALIARKSRFAIRVALVDLGMHSPREGKVK